MSLGEREERALLQEIEGDLQEAPRRKVIYLEGQSDVPIFFGLLGRPEPPRGILDGVLVRGLSSRHGSGGTAVIRRVELASRCARPGVYGVIDGDGRRLSELVPGFDAPFEGPLFTWKAYCIENLLVKTGWPTAWVPGPNPMRALMDHAPYVALNRIHATVRDSLRTLRIAQFNRPSLSEPMKTVADVAAELARDKELLKGYDVEAEFMREVSLFELSVRASLDEGHAFVNGKWLVDVLAPRWLGPSSKPEHCREEWIRHAVSCGGLSEVRDLWERITGRPA
jgi:hypothetical protein